MLLCSWMTESKTHAIKCKKPHLSLIRTLPKDSVSLLHNRTLSRWDGIDFGWSVVLPLPLQSKTTNVVPIFYIFTHHLYVTKYHSYQNIIVSWHHNCHHMSSILSTWPKLHIWWPCSLSWGFPERWTAPLKGILSKPTNKCWIVK